MIPKEEIPSVITAADQTPTEERNIALCKEYMGIAYSPSANHGAESVAHLCHADAWFWAPATFPGCRTPMDYADSHAAVMASVADLRIVRFDQAWAKGGHVLLRYTAEGSHCGKPYKGIEATGRHARWSAAAIFEVEEGRIRSFTKDWDQKTMQIQLGWAPVKESSDPRWNADALANPEKAQKEKE
ncbi:hypothetical protein QBC33DRAFT_547068 [Phialemonium atrogriseum]|uniref:SnoaL-like domain-containing protein n=1 Tax=Phialemonium atrogriseum TaxID=1093897 RepID=A0AAJ0BUT5_9PEZI|nr:uncharacterized protein QBC33DRAFT_547068 [Phialemonium atrogriseum]KAK1764387.1 hypothetical protein QBC33DRAFT_547068 [Phialemonium atrogriseum]